MEDALDQAIRETNQAYARGVRLDRSDIVAILHRYYKGHTIEILGMLEAQHSVAGTFGFEGTD